MGKTNSFMFDDGLEISIFVFVMILFWQEKWTVPKYKETFLSFLDFRYSHFFITNIDMLQTALSVTKQLL